MTILLNANPVTDCTERNYVFINLFLKELCVHQFVLKGVMCSSICTKRNYVFINFY